MSTARRITAGAVAATVAAAVLALLSAGAGGAAPNPFGPSRSTATVLVDSSGGYRATETLEQTMVDRFRLRQGGVVPDGVRLPDDVAATLPAERDDPLPPVLVPAPPQVTVTADGRPVEFRPTVTGHAIDLTVDRGDVVPGERTTVLGVARSGAGLTVGRTLRTYVQLTGRADVTVRAVRGAVIAVRCLTFPGVAVPCGQRDGAGWRVTTDDLPAGDRTGPVALEVSTAATAVVTPRIDRD